MNRMANNIASVSDSAIASPFSSSLNDESYLDIAKMCSSVAGDTNHLLADMAADIEYVGSTEPLLFYGYSSPLERMLLNLLSNSIKYTEKEGKISIELKAEEKYITITVSDNGQGMEENILHDVWNRYAYPTDRLDYKTGTGLGLSVVFRSVRQHKGSAVISSKKGHGTSTIVKLPRRMPNDIMLRDSVTPYLTKGMHPLLVELSDVIEYCRYSNHYLD
jgi:signal transduction histidine kinase